LGKFGWIWAKFGQIKAEIWANMIRFGQNQNVASKNVRSPMAMRLTSETTVLMYMQTF